MAMAYHALGRERESKASLEKAIREQGTDQPNNIASTFAYLGQNVRAFEWLDRAYRRKDPLLLSCRRLGLAACCDGCPLQSVPSVR